MPQQLLLPLWILFIVHFVLFGRLWFRKRTLRLALTTLTFALLTLSFGLRVMVPSWEITAGVEAWWPPRVLAWVGAAASLILWLRERAARSS